MTWIAFAACGAVVARFVARARVGARVRALAGVRLRLSERAADAVSRVPMTRVAIGALGGDVAGGHATAAAGAVLALAYEPLRRARAARAMARALETQVPDVLRALGTALRAGRSLPQAIGAARDESRPPVRALLDSAVQRLSVGASVDASLEAFARATPAAAIAVETVRVGRLAGSNLPAILDVAVTSLAERDRLARDRRAATTQARMSAMVVGAMPLAFFVMAGSGARAQLSILLGDPVGWVLLAAGLTMEAGGALWMRALLRAP